MMRYFEQRKRIEDALACLRPIQQAGGVPTLAAQMVQTAVGSLDDALVEIAEARSLTIAEKSAAAHADAEPAAAAPAHVSHF